MKRILTALLTAAVCLSLCGCGLIDGFQYVDAMELYEEGAYAEALPCFEALGDYSDAQAMAQLCRQNLLYAEAEALLAAGAYGEALELYQELGPQKDSPLKALTCRYALGQCCMASGDYEGAYTWFLELEGYEDAAERVEEARWLWLWADLAKNGPIRFSVDPEGTKVLSLSALETGRLLLTYTAEGVLLDMPYADTLAIAFGHYGADASYEALCVSQADPAVTEEASGPLCTSRFLPGAPVEIDRFRQSLAAASADPVISEDPEQMMLVKGLFSTAQMAVQEHLEALIRQTGLPITVRDLGFSES